MYIRYALLLLLCCTALNAQQLQLTLIMNPNPSPYLSDWQTRHETVIVSITNTQQNPVAVKLKARVLVGGPTGQLIAETKFADMPVLNLPPGATIVSAEEIVPQQAIKFYGGVDQSTVQTGRIPSGNYVLCVELLSAQNQNPLTPQKCGSFNIQQFIAPQLLNPLNDAQLTMDQLRATVLRWSRETPPTTGATAELVVVELQNNQPTWQAVSSNPPVYITQVPGETPQLVWPADVMLPANRTYAWSVRMLDDKGRQFTEPPWAQPFVFTIIPPVTQTTTCNCNDASILIGQAVENNPSLASLNNTSTAVANTQVTGSLSDLSLNQLLVFQPRFGCESACIRKVEWNITSSVAQEEWGNVTQLRLSTIEPFESATHGANFNVFLSHFGEYVVTCTLTIASPEAVLSPTYSPTVVVKSLSFSASDVNTKPPTDPDRWIKITNPRKPCVGVVSSGAGGGGSGSIADMDFEYKGNYEYFIVTILDNPCGTYDPPYTPTIPGGGTTTTPSGQGVTITGGANDTYPKTHQSGAIPSNRSGSQSYSVPVSTFVTPGAAYVATVTGVFSETAADGTETTGTTTSDPICDRYSPPVPSTGVPVAPVPCPTVLVCGPGFEKNPATPISATLELRDADTYKYPRAAPLRANAIDFDYAIFTCEGCSGGKAEKWIPVRDLATIVKWKLKGKGSLNVPFDGKSLKAIDDEIDELMNKLAAISDSISLLTSQRDKAVKDHAAAVEEAKASSAKLKTEQKEFEDSVAALTTRFEDVKKQLDSTTAKLKEIHTLFAESKDSARVGQDSVKKYDVLLTDPLSSAEIKLLADVSSSMEKLKSAQSKADAAKSALATESEVLQAEIRAKDSLLTMAQKKYKSAQELAGSETKSVSDLQSKLYATPSLVAYRGSRRDLQKQTSSYVATFYDAAGTTLFNERIAFMMAESEAMLSTMVAVERAAHFKSFDSAAGLAHASLGSACGGIADPGRKIGCEGTVDALKLSIDSYHTDVKKCSTKVDFLSPPLSAKIAASRTALTAKGKAVATASAEVKTAEMAYKSALELYKTKISTLVAKNNMAIEALESAKNSQTDAQRKYQVEKEKRETEFLKNRQTFSDRRAGFAFSRDKGLRSIDSLIPLNEQKRADSISFALRSDSITSAKSVFEKAVAALKARIADLETLIKKSADDIAKPFNDKIARLKKDSADIENRLKELNKSKETIMGGGKNADGEFAYYIPPPLEVIMTKKDEFEALKDSLGRAEAAVAAALANKEALQGAFVRLVESIAADLVSSKQLAADIASAESDIKDVDKELARLKADVSEKHQKKMQKVDDVKATATDAEKTSDANYLAAIKSAADIAKEMDVLRTKITAASDELLKKRDDVKSAIEKRAGLLKDLADKGKTTESVANELNVAKKTLRTDERTERKADDKVRRAIALESTTDEASSRAEHNAARAKTKASKVTISAATDALKSIGVSLSSDFSKLVLEDTAVSKSLAKYIEADKKHKDLLKLYELKANQFLAANQTAEYWRGVRDKAVTLGERASKVLEEMPSADDAVDSDVDIADLEYQRKALQCRADSAATRIKGNTASIEATVKQREELQKAADDKLKAANEKLASAHAAMNAFLDDQFQHPEHADTIELTVEDRVVDGMRSDDKEKKIECVIKYDKKRTPYLECPALSTVTPPEKEINGPCIPSVGPISNGPVTGSSPILTMKEPRTIALVYKDGAPLWKQWPVLTEPNVLAKDVVVVKGVGSDGDVFIHSCVPQVPFCTPPSPVEYGVADLASRTWSGKGTFRHVLERSEMVLWEPELVAAGCKEEQVPEADYTANEIAPDGKPNYKGKIEVLPAQMLEVTDSLVGWPKKQDTVRVRIVTGDHIGLAGETITLKARLVAGSSEDWGLDGTLKETEKTTDGDGYVKVPFAYGTGYAKFMISVSWNHGEECDKDSVPAIAPLHLKFHRLGKAHPTIAWTPALEIFDGGSADGAMKKMPDITEDSNPYMKMIHGIAGYLDEKRDFVNDQLMKFKDVSPKFSYEPESEKTTAFGIARTQVTDTILDVAISMKAFCEDSLKPICRPAEQTKSYNPKGDNIFKIGAAGDLFVIETDEPFGEGDVISGTGKIKINVPSEFLQSLVDLPVTISDVEVDGGKVATKGKVTWNAGGITASLGAFKIPIDQLFIRAKEGAGIDGRVEHSSLETAVEFSAELGAKGDFYGEARNLPSVAFAGFELKQGASVAVDFHRTQPEKSPLGADFRGIVIGQAQLMLPKIFTMPKTDEPTVITATNLAIGNSGVTGKLEIKSGPIGIGYAKFLVSVNALSMEFDKSRLVAGSISGAFSLDKPFSGTLNSTLSYDGSKWSADFDTKSSLVIPRWKTVVSIRPGTRIEWDEKKSLGKFTLVSTIQSDRFGTIEIDKLMYSSDGKFEIEGGIKKEVDIKVLKGFDLHLTGAEIKASNEEFELNLSGSIGIPGIGLKELGGAVIVKPGPEVGFEFTKGDVTIKSGPFTLDGKLTYKDNEFYAKLGVEIKNVLKGIEGEIYVGTQPLTETTSYTYWYVGMSVETAIPLGQSGLSFTQFGGGIGWNCSPPLGQERPTPEFNDGIALRASVGIGNTGIPITLTGALFDSRFVMIYKPGSITLHGEAWLMKQRENLRGSGTLVIAWSPKTSVSGDIQARIALPDNDGRIVLMTGKVNFEFSDPKFVVESEYLDASFFGLLHANAQFKVTTKSGFFKGKVWYEIEKSAGILVGTLNARLSMVADADLAYTTSPITFTGALGLKGTAVASVSSVFGSYDIASASITCAAKVATSAKKFTLSGTTDVHVSVLGFTGDVKFDLGVEV